jgi:hypothetical protein
MVSTLKFDHVSVLGQFAIASHGRAFSIQRGLAGLPHISSQNANPARWAGRGEIPDQYLAGTI